MKNIALITQETVLAEKAKREAEDRLEISRRDAKNKKILEGNRREQNRYLTVQPEEKGTTAYVLDTDKGLVRIDNRVFCVDHPEAPVRLPSNADSVLLQRFPSVRVPYAGKAFAEQALKAVVNESGQARDETRKCADIREILPAYLSAYQAGKELPEPIEEQSEEEEKQPEGTGTNTYELIKQIVGA